MGEAPRAGNVLQAVEKSVLSMAVGAAAIVALLIVLVTFGFLLFMGVSKIMAGVAFLVALFLVVRKQWTPAIVLGVAGVALLVFEPFSLTVSEVSLMMGVSP